MDMLARQCLIRERGGSVAGETQVPMRGILPIYKFSRKLSQMEMECLGLEENSWPPMMLNEPCTHFTVYKLPA